MKAPAMHRPLDITEAMDWESIRTMIGGESHVSGKALHKGSDGQSECGLWICTPDKWEYHMTRDEVCHFLEGRGTYSNASGDVIESTPDSAGLFPKGWQGASPVHVTVKKVCTIR
ncbi:hypothetical protein GGQ68_004441 [Sagittula marina]|uniref:(S)-ureidoglycine aminohydrolase cupin domain-containing protein n=2 Tax=Sagittula marina TaxID=943940 RepID=A0A7W6GUE3_9RHOB|nr:cupin domain-containing protein [Sagittula marina]MBB3988085.1 hypothetical protein [Sagittula marina]